MTLSQSSESRRTMEDEMRTFRRSVVGRISAMALSLALVAALAQSQEPLTLSQAVATAAGINLARTAYLPRVDGLVQLNRATRNNVFGPLLPQSVIPSMSGPVLGTNDMTNVWGSAVSLLVSWEPYDF